MSETALQAPMPPDGLPEAKTTPVATFEEAVALTQAHISDMSFTGQGFVVEGGAAYADDLRAGLNKLVAEATSEDSNPNLKGFVTLLGRMSEERGFDPWVPEEDPMVSFLVSRGAYKERRPATMPETPDVPRDPGDRRVRRLGNTVIADGHVVQGEIVRGVGVRTAEGIVRTRGTPRTSNS